MNTPDLEHGLPASIDAERSILGAILLENGLYYEAKEHLAEADFALDSHRVIFRRVDGMMHEGRPIDIVTLSGLLQDHKEIQSVGGMAYLFSLTEGLPRRISIAEYVRIVKEKSLLRKVIGVCSSAITSAADQTVNAHDLISKTDQYLLEISGDGNTDWPNLEKQSLQEIEIINRQRSGERPSYFEYGILKLDNLVGGLVKKEMTVLGGRPGQGKSSLVAQIAVRHARRGVPVHIFSLEMSAGKFLRRIWSDVTGIPFNYLRHPERLSKDDYTRVANAMAEVSSWPLVIDDTATFSVDQLVSRARISKRRQATQIVAVDYLQKLRFSRDLKHRYMEVTNAAVSLARLAKEEDIALLVLSSLTENSDKKDRNKPPALSDFRQSGDIQFEASTALLIHREVDDESEKLRLNGELIVAKARDDEQGIVPVMFNKDFLTFEAA